VSVMASNNNVPAKVSKAPARIYSLLVVDSATARK
jgi:hypothetical protein